MHAEKNKIRQFGVMVVAVAVLVGSCKSTSQKEIATYGEPGAKKVHVLVAGPGAMNPGKHYFERGVTLEDALYASGNMRNPFTDKVTVFHWAENRWENKSYHYYQMEPDTRKAIVLQDSDELHFPCIFP